MTTEQTSREDKLFSRLIAAGAMRLPHRLAEWPVFIGDADVYLMELERFAVRVEALDSGPLVAG